MDNTQFTPAPTGLVGSNRVCRLSSLSLPPVPVPRGWGDSRWALERREILRSGAYVFAMRLGVIAAVHLPFHRVVTNLSWFSAITNTNRTPFQRFTFASPAFVVSCPGSAMTLPLVPLLQRQLETTLRLLISVSGEMTPDEIMAVRIRLTEATLVMGEIVVNSSNDAGDSDSPPSRIDFVLDVLNNRWCCCNPSNYQHRRG